MEVNQDLGKKTVLKGREHIARVNQLGIPVVSAIGMLFGSTPVHSVDYVTPNSSENSPYVQTLSDADLAKLDRSKLTHKVFAPQIANGTNDIESGYNTTHLGFDSEDIGYIKLPEFKQQVDLIRSQNQTEIRFGMPRWEGAKLTPDKTDIVWDEQQLQYFKEASLYAQSKGLEVFFVTTPPEVPDGFDFNQYLEITRKFYERIGSEFPGVIHQPGNEYDVHNVLNYGDYGHEITDKELSDYQKWLGVTVHALRKNDPLTQITQSLTGYPMDVSTINKWERIANAIEANIDFFSLDTYPRSIEEAKDLPRLVGLFRDTVRRKVVVTEVGVPTAEGAYTQQQQSDILVAAIKAYKDAGITLLLYQLADEPNKNSDGSIGARVQESFGVEGKLAFGPVADALEQKQPSK